MGYTTILDIMGSIIIGGLLMLILFRLTDGAAQNTYNYSQDLIVQQNLTTVVEILENDLRQAGYCKDWSKSRAPNPAIIAADTSSITFREDLHNNGNLNTIRYYLGPTSELTSSTNPNDRLLYRVVDGAVPKSANLGITEFKLEYYDTMGKKLSCPVSTPDMIKSIQVSVRVEDPEPRINQYGKLEYVDAFWRQFRLEARNLNSR